MDIVISEEKGIRQLHFGSDWVQGAMRISRPYDLELEYTQEMMAPLLFNTQVNWPRHALLIGLGVGALPKFLIKHKPHCNVTVVEISRAVVIAAQMHFKLPPFTPNFRVEVGCGADYLVQWVSANRHQFDLILVDGFDAKAKVGPLNSTSFYLNCKASLTGQGYFSVNLLGNQKDFMTNRQRFIDAFDTHAFTLKPCASGNSIGLAHVGAGFDFSPAELQANCSQLKQETQLNLSSTVSKLIQSFSNVK
jgi:spermidine synthase